MNLSGESIKDTYGGILNIGAAGLTGALTTITDGLGNPLPMQVSTTGVNFTGTVTGISGTTGATGPQGPTGAQGPTGSVSAPAVRTGSSILFDTPSVYGTPSAPVSGNITLAAGTNNSGVLATLVHSQKDVPDFGAEFQIYNALAYNTAYGLSTGQPCVYYPTGYNGGFNQFVYSLGETSVGDFYVGGAFTTYQQVPINWLCKIFANGDLDTSFTSGLPSTGYPAVYAIAVASDDKVYIGGQFITYNGATASNCMRLNTDGTLDTSFDTSGGFNGYVYSIVVQSDGKVLVGGDFTTYNGVTANRIIRLNTDGTKDTSFDNSTGFNTGSVTKISLGPTGTVWALGSFTAYKGTTTRKVVHLSSDGSIAPGWSFTTGVAGGDGNIYAMLTGDAANGCYLGGGFTSIQGATGTAYLGRVTATGSVDTTFQGGGFTQVGPGGGGIQIQALGWGATGSTGGILVNGSTYNYYNGQSLGGYGKIVKLTPTGATAAGFTGAQIQNYDVVNTYWGWTNAQYASITSTGKSMFYGAFTGGADEQFSRGLIRFNANGSVDTTFNTSAETTPVINYIGATYFDGTVKYNIYN